MQVQGISCTCKKLIASAISLFFLLFLITSCSSSFSKKPRTLTANIFEEPPTLDSRLASDSISMNVIYALFEGLVRMNEYDRPELALAKKIHLSDDGCCYTLYLRESNWNQGERVTADDFLMTWQSILDPAFPAPFAYKLFDIKNAKEIKEGLLPKEALGVRVLDSYTLQIELNYPVPYFLELLAFPTFYPRYLKSDSTSTISNGPFSLTSWDHHNQITLHKNNTYWDKKAVSLKELSFVMVPDSTTEYHMYELGELDIAGAPLSILPPDLLPHVENLQIIPIQALYYYAFNTKIPFLSSKLIRKALAMAIHRQDLVDHILLGQQKIATALVPPLPHRDAKEYFTDNSPLLAQELLQQGMEELGLSKIPTLTLSYNQSDDHHRIAQMIQQQWKNQLNLDVHLEHYDWQVYLDKMSHSNFEIARAAWVSETSDPISFLNLFRNDDRINSTRWIHPDYQQLLTDAETSKERSLLLDRAEALLMDEMPIIPLFFINCCYLQKKHVQGVHRSRSGMIDFKKASVRKSP